MIHHLVRRGVDIVSSQADLRAPVSAGDDHDSPVEIPRFAVLAIGMTMTIALLMMTSVRFNQIHLTGRIEADAPTRSDTHSGAS